MSIEKILVEKNIEKKNVEPKKSKSQKFPSTFFFRPENFLDFYFRSKKIFIFGVGKKKDHSFDVKF